ncbi:MAG: hypothetical protein ACLFUZ_03675 [Candidatus Micrarchaeia archaeon]
MDAEKLAKKVSERLGTYEKRSYSEKASENSDHKFMRWRRPRSIM